MALQVCEPENECEENCKCTEHEGCWCDEVTCPPFKDGDKCLVGGMCKPHEGCWYDRKECKPDPKKCEAAPCSCDSATGDCSCKEKVCPEEACKVSKGCAHPFLQDDR